MVRHVLLALLANDEPAHGYGLMKSYRARTGVKLSIGNVYRDLQRLAAEGLIATVVNPPGVDARRAPYEVTEQGREVLAGWLASPLDDSGRYVSDEVACRLAVVGDLDAVETARVLEAMRCQLWDLAKRVERERAAAAASDGDGGKALSVRRALLARQALHLAADIELVGEIMASLDAEQQSVDPVEERAAPDGRQSAYDARPGRRGGHLP